MKKKDQACKIHLEKDPKFYARVQLYMGWLRSITDTDHRLARFVFDLDKKDRDALGMAFMIFEEPKKGKPYEEISSNSLDCNLCVNCTRSSSGSKKKPKVSMQRKREISARDIQDNSSGQTDGSGSQSKKRLKRR